MSWKEILKGEFPKEILHDNILYYVDGYLENPDGEVGIYYTEDKDAPDQVLHLYLDEAKEKEVKA